MEDDPIEAAYPALVVSVGSGVSIIKVRQRVMELEPLNGGVDL